MMTAVKRVAAGVDLHTLASHADVGTAKQQRQRAGLDCPLARGRPGWPLRPCLVRNQERTAASAPPAASRLAWQALQGRVQAQLADRRRAGRDERWGTRPPCPV
eukprot:scaffold34250_cov101-Isochrysis_galbana.AAC.1